MKPLRTLVPLVALAALFGLYWPLGDTPEPSATAMTRSNKLDRLTTPIPDTPIQACINLGGALEAPVEGQWGYQIRTEDLGRIARAGFDTVRLPVAWSEHTEQTAPYTISPTLLARTDEVIKAALEQDLNIILNVHHYWELMSKPDQHEPRLDAIWRQLSDHYAGWPEGLMFEFLNEPHKRMTGERVAAMNQRLLTMIRPRHPDRYVVLSGGRWGGLEGMMETQPPEDDRVIMSFHYYNPHKFTHQGASFDPRSAPTGQVWGSEQDRIELESVMSAAAHFKLRTGKPVFLGEFGVYADVPTRQRAEWTREVRMAAEQRGISWCYFDWATTFRIYDLDHERWVRPIRQALLP
jgi:endoglucanase